MLEFQVLGPLEVVRDGKPLSVTGQKLRALLASLIIHANHAVLPDTLIDELWGERAPPTARTSLQNLVARLRKLLGADALETRGPGYVLLAGVDQVDSTCFEALVARARDEAPTAQVATLERALGLWRGPPFSDVFYETFAQGEIGRLEELRVAAFEALYAAKLELGLTGELVPPLRSLVESYPYRERLRQQLMVALYRSGRGVDALRTFVEWRVRVTEEWNMAPGHAIERTAADIRHLSPELDEMLLWGRIGHPVARSRHRPGGDPLAGLEVEQAMTVLAAAEAAAGGAPDGLEELDDERVAAINAALVRHWRPA